MPKLATVLERSVFMASPQSGTATHAATYALNNDGRLTSVHGHESRSDTIDDAFIRTSEDNGETWSTEVNWPTRFDDPEGTGRRHHRGAYLDPPTGRVLALWTEGVLPTDDPLEGMWRWTLHCAVSMDGGRSFPVSEQIVHEGDRYDAVHHLPGIAVGHNCVMMGDLGERPLTRADGVILVPVQVSRTGPDGQYANPGAGFTFLDSMVLMGRWQPDGRLAWTTSDRVWSDHEKTTRGLFEPTLAKLSDDRLLMVMRGSNDSRSTLPGRRWCTFSADGGQSWCEPAPWTYANGDPFFSPSSCSQLIPWSDGRILWMGNICAENPQGNSPRYPFVLGMVDPDSGLLVRDSVVALDDRAPDESPRLTLSNFYARRDPITGHLLLHLTRLFARNQPNQPTDWTADALQYRIAVH